MIIRLQIHIKLAKPKVNQINFIRIFPKPHDKIIGLYVPMNQSSTMHPFNTPQHLICQQNYRMR